jgi:hypothetical protein
MASISRWLFPCHPSQLFAQLLVKFHPPTQLLAHHPTPIPNCHDDEDEDSDGR